MGSNLGIVRSRRPDPQLTRHFDELYPTLEELLNAADAAEKLLSTPGWDVLQSLLQAEIATIDAELDSGRVLESRADYAAKHGRRGGLRASEELLRALISRAAARFEEQRRKHEGDAAEPALAERG